MSIFQSLDWMSMKIEQSMPELIQGGTPPDLDASLSVLNSSHASRHDLKSRRSPCPDLISSAASSLLHHVAPLMVLMTIDELYIV
ncbi:hypothetical protein TIFTF001_028086 [Ficus carica]|uniref:Uncharacterized protein n=1 Tax=Ficus carica TaxID=3494 RepID=A0AA88DP95_FICCA|nr:hypothetical protein TIFTF001_028086 [Ficus carica]